LTFPALLSRNPWSYELILELFMKFSLKEYI